MPNCIKLAYWQNWMLSGTINQTMGNNLSSRCKYFKLYFRITAR